MTRSKEDESLNDFWRRHHWQSIRATAQTFGIGADLLRVLILYTLWRESTLLFMQLDNLFFPAWRRMTVDRPVFIIGHPRSGTTMLHRCLTSTEDFVVFKFWHLLFPSLTSRKLLGPLMDRLIRQGKDVIVPKKVGHLFALGEVDEEDFLFLFHALTQFYPPLGGLAFSDEDFDDIVFCDDLPAKLRRESMAWFDGCIRRQILFTGRQRVVTKMNYSAMRVRTLLEAYPDARIVYLVRSPLDTIPSHLSLHQNVCYHQWGKDRLPPAVLDRYIRRRYEHNVSLYRYVEDLLAAGHLPESRVITVRYEDMMRDLEGEVGRVAAFCDLDLSDALRRSIAEQARAQRGYKREHNNQNMDEFGLTRADVLRDLGFIFDRYGFDREA
ncbi:MAG: sulfotransferase [Anaerolineales bacterium]